MKDTARYRTKARARAITMKATSTMLARSEVGQRLEVITRELRYFLADRGASGSSSSGEDCSCVKSAMKS